MTDQVAATETAITETPATTESHADPAKFQASLEALAKEAGVDPKEVQQNLPKRVLEELPPEPVEEKKDEKVPEAKEEPKKEEPAQTAKETPEQVRARLDAKAKEYSLAYRAQQDAARYKAERDAAHAQREAALLQAQEAAKYADAAKDPAKWLEIADQNGVSPKQLADAVVKRERPLTPEEIIERAKAEGKAEALRVLAEQQAQQAAQFAQQRQMQEISGFIGYVGQSKNGELDAFPALKALFTPQQLAYEFHAVRQLPNENGNPGGHFGRIEARGHSYTFDDVAKYLEEQNTPRYKQISDTFSQGNVSSQPSSQSASTPAQSSAASTTARAPAVSGSASSPTTLPANYASLSKEEQARLDLALYEKIRQR